MATCWGIVAIHASPLCWPLTLTLSRGPLQRFNVAHCRTRARVEMTIGILKSQFQCLQKLRITPERACDIIVACVVLHNIAIIRGEQHPAVQINDPADDHPIPAADVQDGRAARELIARWVIIILLIKNKIQDKFTCDLVLLYSLQVQKQQSGFVINGAFQATRNSWIHKLRPVKVVWNGSQTRNSRPVNSYVIDVLPVRFLTSPT